MASIADLWSGIVSIKCGRWHEALADVAISSPTKRFLCRTSEACAAYDTCIDWPMTPSPRTPFRGPSH